MRILFANIFVSYTAEIIIEKLKKMGYEVTVKSYYTPDDLYHDEKIDGMIKRDIKSEPLDLVFTVNIWPPVARVCHEAGLPYVAWSYDSPQNLPEITDLNYDTNFLYIFDREEAKIYHSKGIDRIFHMPLATDTDTWDRIRPGKNAYDVSLLGTLYESTLPAILSATDEYHQGYIRAIAAAQQKIYGYYMIDELLTDEFMKELNASIKGDDLKAAQLSYSIATYITYLDRLTLLKIFSGRFDTHLFSSYINEETARVIPDVKIHDRADYLTGMPAVFKSSRINLNPSLRIIRSGIPLRCLDVMGCGGFLLSSYQPELAECFTHDEEVVLYDSYEDAYEKAAFYIEHDDLRTQIAANGYNKVKNEFSYEKRLSNILDAI